jgi:hypothetical protein
MCSAPTKKFSGKNHTGSSATSPYPVSRLAPATELVDLAQTIADADQTIQSHVNSKLNVIADQIKALQDQAHQILEQAQQDQLLHRAECQCKRIIGHSYFLYEKQADKLYFSMLSPEDWGGSPPHKFKGAYRLEQDMSWTAVNEDDKPQPAYSREDWSNLLKLTDQK